MHTVTGTPPSTIFSTPAAGGLRHRGPHRTPDRSPDRSPDRRDRLDVSASYSPSASTSGQNSAQGSRAGSPAHDCATRRKVNITVEDVNRIADDVIKQFEQHLRVKRMRGTVDAMSQEDRDALGFVLKDYQKQMSTDSNTALSEAGTASPPFGSSPPKRGFFSTVAAVLGFSR